MPWAGGRGLGGGMGTSCLIGTEFQLRKVKLHEMDVRGAQRCDALHATELYSEMR